MLIVNIITKGKIESLADALPKEIARLTEKLNKARLAYIKLTNCEAYTDNIGNDTAGHYCPNALLEEFDECFKDDL